MKSVASRILKSTPVNSAMTSSFLPSKTEICALPLPSSEFKENGEINGWYSLTY
jgi:hypothetical protein